LLAVVAFAVGIGSTTTIFTVINGVLLRPLPYPDGERFVSLYGVNTTDPGTPMQMPVPELQDYEQQTTSFDAFGWFRTGRFKLTVPGEPQFVPRRGGDARARGGSSVHRSSGSGSPTTRAPSSRSALWRRLGGAREIIGSAITLDGRQHTVSGVMPPTFQLPVMSLGISRGETEVWIPLDPSPPGANRGNGNNVAYARRKPGVSLEQAQADVRRVAAIVAPKDPERYRFYTAGAADLREATIGMIGRIAPASARTRNRC
jgi:hypothetical protein